MEGALENKVENFTLHRVVGYFSVGGIAIFNCCNIKALVNSNLVQGH